jgi:4-amino-4-deoxy-L-arabinose transferase-like glycosyltransferase
MENPSDKHNFVENKHPGNTGGESAGQEKAASGFPAHYFILLGLILWTFGCNQIWTLLDARPLSWDPAAHLRIAFGYWSAFTSGSDRVWLDLLSVESFYPPFYHLSLLPVLAGLGFSADNAVMVNSFYMAVIILSTYGIGQRLYGRSTGLLAAFLISCYPFLAYVSRQLSIGTALTAAVALSYYLFLRSENFENRKFSFWFSCSFAVGLMFKWTFIFYLLPAILIGLFYTEAGRPRKVLKKTAYYLGMIFALMVLPLVIFILGKGREGVLILECALVFALVRCFPAVNISAKKIIAILTLTFISLLVCFPWYAHNLAKMSRGIAKFGLPDMVLKGDMVWDLPIWGYYLEIADRQMGLPLFLLFVVGFVAFLFNRKNFNWLLCGWIVLPFLVFTFINNKGVRYTMPCLPAIAVLSALLLIQINKSKVRTGAVGLVVAVSVFTYIYAGFLPGDVKTPGLGSSFFGYKGLPVKENWHINSILDDIIQESAPPPGKTITVRTLTNHAWFHRGAFRDAALIRGLPIIVKSVKRNQGELTDYFITKDSSQEGESGNRQINPKRDRLFNDPTLSKTFSLFKTYPLPNGARGLVFKRDVSPIKDIAGAIDLAEVGKRFIEALPHYPIYGIKHIKNARISIVPTDNAEDVYLGRYKKITLTADSAVSNKIRLDDFELTFHDVQINLYELFLHGKLILFEIGRLFPRATIQFEPLEQLALKEMKGKGDVRLEGEGDRLRLRAQYQLPSPFGTIDGNAEVRLNFEPGKSIRPQVETVTAGPLAAREIFYRRILDEKIILTPTAGWPLFTDIRTINIFPRRLEINQSSKGSS